MKQDECTIVATNPVERWSPMIGHITGNLIRTNVDLKTVGTLSEDHQTITWDDNVSTVWSVMKARPKEEGLETVRTMLQFAIETEQSVIQPYLSALYSIHPGSNANAFSMLHGVVVEEMLHMTTAANVLNAIGGHPEMNTQSFVPVYPMKLPFVNMSMNLKPFTPSQMDMFRRVEEATWGPENEYRVNTVAVYYFRIGMHLEALVKAYGENAIYTGNPALQVDVGSSRGVAPGIYNHTSAMKFLTGIYTQGEGTKDELFETSLYTGQSELSHYYRFNELNKDRCYANNTKDLEHPTGSSLGIDWSAVYKFKTNPKTADFAKYPVIHKQMQEFNSCYTHLLAGLHDVFNGHPDGFWQRVDEMMTVGELAKTLMATPHPEHADMTVGPAWEWINISSNEAPKCPSRVSLV